VIIILAINVTFIVTIVIALVPGLVPFNVIVL